MEPKQKVLLYLETTQQNPDAGLDEIAQALIQRGLSLVDAEALLAFVPMGFAYVLFSSEGVTLCESFQVFDPATREERRGFLVDQPIFQAALETADQMFGEPSAADHAYQVAKSSAEFAAVNHFCLAGASLHEISLTEAVLTRLPIDYL